MATVAVNRRPGRRSVTRSRSGTAAVEFGLVIVPFLLFIFAIIEFGRFMWVQHTLESACDAGAQYVYAHSNDLVATTVAALPAYVRTNATGLTSTAVTVTATSAGTTITITATYPFTYASILGLGPATVTARATAPVE